MRRLWKASRLFNVPINHPYIRNLNDYDLYLMEYLHLFEDPKKVEEYLTVIVDEDFEEYVRETEEMDNQTHVSNNKDEWIEIEE